MGWLQIRLHLRELFASKLDAAEGASGRDRKMSASSTGSMKSKWLKAFKSLKTTSGPSNGTSPKEGEKKNGRDSGLNLGLESTVHQFQEYTYKKITPCDVCSQVLRGHTRQGLKCRVCKLNVHLDCQDKVGRCQAKSRLLRRQKSTSEIETRVIPAQEEEASSEQASPGEVDAVYQVLKQAGEISTSRSLTSRSAVPTDLPPARRAQQPPLMLRGASTLTVGPAPHASSSEQAQYAAGTRPFGQPLVLGGSQENGNTSPLPQKGSNKKR